MARLEVIIGPMFSGKSEEMVRRLRRAAFAKKSLLLATPSLDDRKTRNILAIVAKDTKLSSYERLTAHKFDNAQELAEIIRQEKPDVLAMDEAQFPNYDHALLDLLIDLLNEKKNENFTIIVSGLNLDAEGRPFGIVPDLMARAEEIALLTAICTQCGNEAFFTQKLKGSQKQIEVGDDIYTARCRECFIAQSKMNLG